MEQWIVLSLLLCTFGLLREIRPSEPYISEFLLGEWRNITEEVLYQDVYPVGTYSYMALLVIIFLITDFLKYKPLIIASGIFFCIFFLNFIIKQLFYIIAQNKFLVLTLFKFKLLV